MKNTEGFEFSLSEKEILELNSKIALKNPTYSSNFEKLLLNKAIEQSKNNPEAVNNFKENIKSERLQEIIQTKKETVEYKNLSELINKFNNNESLSANDQKSLSNKIQNFAEKLSEKIKEQEGTIIEPEVIVNIAMNINHKEEMGEKASIDEVVFDEDTKNKINKIMQDPKKGQELMEKISNVRKLRS